MKPSFDDMQMFWEVTETRSFTAAAERLGRTKSAVSQAVSRLEADLGTRLLHRTTRSLSLTDAGTRFLSHCRDLRSVYDQAISDMAAGAAPLGRLSVTVPDALAGPLVAPVVAEYVSRFPSVNVRFHSSDSTADLIEAQIDLALRIGEPKAQSAKITKLGSLRKYVYASPALIKARGGPPQTLEELKDWPHIANDWQGTPVRYDTSDGQSLRVTPCVRCNSFNETRRLVELGAGVARLPAIATTESVGSNSLEPLFDTGEVPVYAMHHFTQHPPAKVQRFVEMIRKKLKDLHADPIKVPGAKKAA